MQKIYDLLRCPDDGSSIIPGDDFIECPLCKRKYVILAENFLEILPSEFPEWNLHEEEPRRAEELYLKEFKQPFTWTETPSGWGDLTTAHPGTRGFYTAESNKIEGFLRPSSHAFGIDVSGAVGNYAIFLSDKVEAMVNCDLHAPSIITAYNRKRNNMLCIRTPYLKLPFASNSFDYAVCTDTLIRGRDHEVRLLREILRVLKPRGKAFVDFHNLKWYAKNRHLCAYNRGSVRQLLSEANIIQYSIHPFGFVPTRMVFKESLYPILDDLFKFLSPPKRHIVVFTKTDGSG
jgi:SAM-dependent methyltransferase